MNDTLFAMFTTHCFYNCGHKTVEANMTGSSDAMERHYWDAHYTRESRDDLRAKGQAPERIGATR